MNPMTLTKPIRLLWALALLAPFATAGAQTAVDRPVSLEAAVAEARTGALALATAEGEAAIAAARARGAGSFLYPNVGVGVGVTRSTDPVFAFGAKLRQGVFAQEDLALEALNDPAAISDWATTLDVTWGALDPGRWAGWSAARSAADAAGWSAARTREATELEARVRYWAAVGATARREAAEASRKAAAATLEVFRRREDRGLLTEADRLRAEAELAAARAAVADAARAEREARRDLGVFLGWPSDAIPVPVDTLAPPTVPARAGFEAAARADLRAMEAGLEAAAARGRAADLAFLPSVQAFGRIAGHGDGVGPDDGDWTVGVALTWTAFAGFGRLAERSAADHAERIARLAYRHALHRAVAEVDVADYAVEAAAEASAAALEARRAAGTASDLMRRRFEEGLATATDLLQAEARKADAAGRAVDAMAAWRLAAARADFVRSTSDREDLR